MAKTYLDILSERGVRPFLTDEAFEELQKFDYKSQYAIPGQVMPVFKHPNHQSDRRYVLVRSQRGGGGTGHPVRHGGARCGQAPFGLEEGR